uniref:Uncharacterized protein n=1 Tax=Anguilla anguilla TaxID=7936 RepID=A0A0E9PBZ8_ANGAN
MTENHEGLVSRAKIKTSPTLKEIFNEDLYLKYFFSLGLGLIHV